jgi:hypothetical protein
MKEIGIEEDSGSAEASATDSDSYHFFHPVGLGPAIVISHQKAQELAGKRVAPKPTAVVPETQSDLELELISDHDGRMAALHKVEYSGLKYQKLKSCEGKWYKSIIGSYIGTITVAEIVLPPLMRDNPENFKRFVAGLGGFCIASIANAVLVNRGTNVGKKAHTLARDTATLCDRLKVSRDPWIQTELDAGNN